ncbi:hypothetical protein DITRI_Ditri03aG0003100 [Diplodiscus trichospermus]
MKMKRRRLKEEMKNISKKQKRIKEGQSEVGKNLKAIEIECELRKDETKFMFQQSTLTQLRLAVMFKILKAQKEGHSTKAA